VEGFGATKGQESQETKKGSSLVNWMLVMGRCRSK
jgi:hypothetical protein